jgi:hypothetical protein
MRARELRAGASGRVIPGDDGLGDVGAEHDDVVLVFELVHFEAFPRLGEY